MCRCWIERLAIFILLLSYGCASTNTAPSPKESIDCEIEFIHDRKPFSGRIGLFPLRVEMCEINAGGQAEEVPQWSLEGKKIVKQGLLEHFSKEQEIEIVPLATLSDENRQILEQYRELLQVVAANRGFVLMNPGWRHLKDRRYTLGNGLAGIKDQIGVDAILFVSGYNGKTTVGRKVAQTATVVLVGVLTGVIIYMPMDYCYLQTGVIDLETGEVLWNSSVGNGAHSLKNKQDVEKMIDAAFKAFPSERKGKGVNEPIE